jgi:hypothetical protein
MVHPLSIKPRAMASFPNNNLRLLLLTCFVPFIFSAVPVVPARHDQPEAESGEAGGSEVRKSINSY